jgi:hypothetical protein
MDVMEVADEASDEKGVGAALTLAIQLGKVLGKPVRIEGEPVVMNDYAKDAMRRMGEKIARG